MKQYYRKYMSITIKVVKVAQYSISGSHTLCCQSLTVFHFCSARLQTKHHIARIE